jgi:uncharacterized membrane protein YcfT
MMATTTDNGRLDWVDTAKGISILLVVMMHSAYGVGEETGSAGVLHWIIGWATPFRMPEFFLISGLFLALVIGRDWQRFADRRVVHYLYFYALWAVIQIVFKVGLGTGDPLMALTDIAWAVIEPFGVLWFIYMLAVYSAATKLLHQLRVPHWAAFVAGAVLQMAPIATGSGLIDLASEYFVYFYAGYAFAPAIFRLVERAQRHVVLAIAGLMAWAVLNGILVFLPSFEMLPSTHPHMGFADLPGLHLALALSGALALCVAASLIGRLDWMGWLRWLGEHSIVVYLSFSLPMAVTRVVLLKLDLVTDTSLLSIIVMAVAVASPLVLYALIQWTGWGRFLFERPAWAHLPGTAGSRTAPKPAALPAE